jgi:putative nucleotidyltransferase with HDIG domain
MDISASTLVSTVALVLYSVLLIIILRQNIYNWVRFYFSLYLISMIVWSLAAFMIFSSIPIMDALFWNRVLLIGSMGMPVTFFGFVVSFLHKNRLGWMLSGLVAYIIAQVLNVQGLVVTSAYEEGGYLVNNYGPGLTYVSTLWAFFIGFSAYELIKEYRQSRDALYRNRLRYLLLVIIVIFAGNLTNLTDFKSLPTDVGANIISALLITIAILRHHLLDISLVMRKGVLYTIPTVFIGATYFLVLQGVLQLLPKMNNLGLFLISLVAAILTAMIVQPLLNKLQTWIDRIFFREKFDASLMLERISHTVAHVLDLESITQLILDEISNTLHIGTAAFLIKNQDSGDYVLTAQKGFPEGINFRFKLGHAIIRLMSSVEKPLTRQQILVQLRQKKVDNDVLNEIKIIAGELYVPLQVKGDLVGILVLGLKLSELTYTEDDQLTIMTLANQTAVAVENARLFSAEQSRREELDALYELTRQLVVTNDVADVIQNTTRHVVVNAHVTFARILTPDGAGGFYCPAAYPIRSIEYDLGIMRFEPIAALPFYLQALQQHEPLFLQREDARLNPAARSALMLDLAHTIYISPLKVGGEVLGLLVLGERRESNREPFDSNKLRMVSAIADQAANALQRANMHEQMETTFLETVLALANAMDARDTDTQNHSRVLRELAGVLAEEIGCSEEEIWAVRWAALLHDIGKIGVPDEILKKEGALDPHEWAQMKQHPEIGARIVAPVKKLENVAPLIQAHHEYYNGTGYPQGLKGEQIPLGARILTIVDAFSAMTDPKRLYYTARTREDAVRELRSRKGIQFDPALVEVFVDLMERGKFPILNMDRIVTPDKTRPID